MNARIYIIPLIGLHGVDRDHVTCVVVWIYLCAFMYTPGADKLIVQRMLKFVMSNVSCYKAVGSL